MELIDFFKNTSNKSIVIEQENDDSKWFKTDPVTNVISETSFKNRIAKVFKLIYDTLSKSFGPYGANTVISTFSGYHITKDGYTIFKNMYFSTEDNPSDHAIAVMIKDICSRLNYAVGDGTTTATIVTYSIFNNYMKHLEEGEFFNYRSRDIISTFDAVKNDVLDELHTKVKEIGSLEPDKLYDNIYDVAYISSNGDEVIADNIAEVYRQLGRPALNIAMAEDGITRIELDIGYKIRLSLLSKFYAARTESLKLDISGANVVLFQTKVNDFIYEKIIRPLYRESVLRGKKLIVGAATYDDTILKTKIDADVKSDFKSTGEFNLIMCNYANSMPIDKKYIDDFSMLCNTKLLDWDDVKRIKELITNENKTVGEIFNIDNRELVPGYEPDVVYIKDYKTIPSTGEKLLQNIFKTKTREVNESAISNGPMCIEHLIDRPYNLGYVGECELGMKTSVFHELYYDKETYNIYINDAEDELKKAVEKYSKLGAFNTEISSCQKRLYALKLRIATYYIGGDTEVARTSLRDTLDDCIKAAESAYNNGIVKGCSIDILAILYDMIAKNNKDTIYSKIVNILFDAYFDVYRTIISNGYDDFVFVKLNSRGEREYTIDSLSVDDEINIFGELYKTVRSDGSRSKRGLSFEPKEEKYNNDVYSIVTACQDYCSSLTDDNQDIQQFLLDRYGEITLIDMAIMLSFVNNHVLDIRQLKFTDKIINSVRTDEEILKASSDLISLLISGNQMVISPDLKGIEG